MHMQEYAAEAIKLLVQNPTLFSCDCVQVSVVMVGRGGQHACRDLQNAYRDLSNCHITCQGFFHIPMYELAVLPLEQKHTYRLEMLYYFWLANQDM